ncbi:HAMP domain-containing histidine kinase [Faecalicatena sp. AGMB00832]|uniref:histidine kinase n=1 Tax=Faecalicatena faecalis TaxID=2726362 RepID=A0ABS6D1S0_9FIRM|nr:MULTISPECIES: HAMP domain-containing sensor histidine kinase [Faecalicatena]MBU3875548.1 HAMP domain-containing histidine kinase [Faecalicatena faecalis]MCI6466012.1 HAMP domain-containing histidine kinase [Faecalicatena sp.]MDY5620058.1 HAMP domain-containing sensor histidine kinase [Lachnospiraceae bacterium]
MKRKENLQKISLSLFVLLISLLGIGILFYLTYHLDNKYTYKGRDVTVLADGWDFYPEYDRLPANGTATVLPDTDRPITIGEFGTFRSFHKDASPFGSAVYRKQLYLEPSPKGWLLELPEIFSASRVYINGTLVRSYGSLAKDTYNIHIQNTLILLPSGYVEIVIEAANYSHYYSGLIYPPLVGEADAITKLETGRLIFYGLLCFFSLGCAIVSFSVWFRRRIDPLYAAYGLLCFFFAVHISYPLIHWSGINWGEMPYVIEDTAWFAIFACMNVLTYQLPGQHKHRYGYLLCYAFSIGMAALPLPAFYILFPLCPKFIPVYSFLAAVAKIIMSIYLILVSVSGTLRNPQQVWLLSGNAVFGLGILIDYLTAGRFEPLRFGWQTEYCGFIMVLLFTVLISDYNRRILIQRQYLMDHLQDEVNRKTAWLTSMLEERKQFLSAVAHDLKAPVAAINTYIDYIRMSGIGSDEELLHYLDIIDHKSSQIQNNVQSLQLFHTQTSHKSAPEIFDCVEFLKYIYQETVSYADANGIYYQTELPEGPVYLFGHKESLFCAFENMIVNATEHTPYEGTIRLAAAFINDTLKITLSDNGEGIQPEDLPQIFHYEFSTKKGEGLCGLGLYFTKISIEEYGGSINVESRPGMGTTFYITFPIAHMNTPG